MKRLILFILFSFSIGFIYGQRIVDADRVIVRDSLNLGGEEIVIDNATFGQFIYRDSTKWGNKTLSITGWDSIPFNSSTGFLNAYLGGVVDYQTSLDDRYVELSDSITQWVSLTQLNDSLTQLETELSENIKTMVYRVTLPVDGTLSGSAAAATDLPTGWSLSVSGGDLQINHGLGRYSSAVNIRYNTTGSSYRQLRNFDNAYSGVLDVDSNNLTIESISTFYTAYALRITIIFE